MVDPVAYPSLQDLHGTDRQIAAVALTLHDRVEYVGACYLMTLFQYLLLKNEFGIITEPVVGFVNDGTDNQFISHAWLEHDGKRTDIALDRTEYPEILLPGNLIVADRIVSPGHAYTYYRTRPEVGRRAAKLLAKQSPDAAAIVAMKEREHSLMLSISKDDSRISEWLANAPSDRNYEALRLIVLQSDKSPR